MSSGREVGLCVVGAPHADVSAPGRFVGPWRPGPSSPLCLVGVPFLLLSVDISFEGQHRFQEAFQGPS